jgi:hypothetical protein
MSWEYSKFEEVCEQCGRQGFCIEGSDDWGRSSTSWEGFENHEPHPTPVGRKRADIRQMRPVCVCGSSEIVTGKHIQRLLTTLQPQMGRLEER